MTDGIMADIMQIMVNTGIALSQDTSVTHGQTHGQDLETLKQGSLYQLRTGLAHFLPTRETSRRGQIVPAR